MLANAHWISRHTRCAQAWREPRWPLQLLGPRQKSWLHGTLPGIVPAAVAVTTVVVQAVSVAAVRLPSSHGA
jgi:hypothetical protein